MSTDIAGAVTAGENPAAAKRLTFRILREQTLDSGAWVWTGLTEDGYSGSAAGRTLTELFEEIAALKHFILDEDPATDIAVDYVYEVEGFPAEVLASYEHARAARDEAAGAQRRASELLAAKARTTACALRAAGLSVRDGAALMGLSKSRFDQLTA